jgi:hypothetical protein
MQADNSQRDNRLLWYGVAALAAATVFYRVAPYALGLGTQARFVWNLVPVGALALFAGARLRSRWAYAVPLGVMLASDLLLLPYLGARTFSWVGTPLIYGSFVLYVFLGQRLIGRDETSPMVIGGASLLASVQFFLLSNLAVWLGGGTYPRTLAGLAQCYWMAIPFYRNTLAGDLLFTQLFFAVHTLAVHVRAPVKVRQPA